MGFLEYNPHPRQFAKKDGNQPPKLLYIHTHSFVCTQYTRPYRKNPTIWGHIIFYQHFGCSVLMNFVLPTAIQTRRHEKEYAASWLHVPEYRKAQDWKSREFIPSRRRIILWKRSILMYNTAIINQKLCIYLNIECMLTCVSRCVMPTAFVSTTGSRNPDESPEPLWFGMYY